MEKKIAHNLDVSDIAASFEEERVQEVEMILHAVYEVSE